ncbi:hypothetical protein F2Q69_00031288 [Brassica cretica]|uniref:Uncharacterized protein n=1 Tax=Brassica cretica TaxID=69181 RepID=A0A8S9RVD3_BRACR|nr:hypothetical protein F2Q69_00031288 [Brassica cretica]
MSPNSIVLQRGGSSPIPQRELDLEDDIIRLPEYDAAAAADRLRLTLIGRWASPTVILEESLSHTKVSTPGGSLVSVSHDENTCPELTPEERELKRKQRAEAHDPKGLIEFNGASRQNISNCLKRPPISTIWKTQHPLLRPESSNRASQKPYQDRDSSRNPPRGQKDHQNKEVWSRLELRRRSTEPYRSSKTHHAQRPRELSENSNTRRRPEYSQQRTTGNNIRSPRSNHNAPTSPAHQHFGYRAHASSQGLSHNGAVSDSQRTLTEPHNSGQTPDRIPITNLPLIQEFEEERILCIKRKAPVTDTPTAREKLLPPLHSKLVIRDNSTLPSSPAPARYALDSPLKSSRMI